MLKFLLLMLFSFCAQAQITWSVPVDKVINLAPIRQQQQVSIFANSYTGVGPLAGVWQFVDLKPRGVPANALAADFQGLLIITGAGYASETADLGVVFRKPGDSAVACSTNHYAGQAVLVTNQVGSQTILGGIRSTIHVMIPLTDGAFEWCWTRSTSGNWPTNSSYGVNLGLRAYYIPKQ